MLAKLITYALVGIGYALVCIAVTTAIALPWLNAKGIQVPLGGNGIPATLAGVVAAVAHLRPSSASDWAPWSASRSPPWSACWSTCSSPNPSSPASRPLRSWTIYLPGAAANALTQVAQANQDFLPPWQGGLVLAAYGLILAAAGTFLTTRRDIT